MVKDLIEYIVKGMVSSPEHVVITTNSSDDKEVVLIKVSEEDKGKVIGREGQTIKSLRTVADLMANKHKKISIDLAK
jgi:predicted RNA-binding protein YlqC (UPF0109 family)